MSKWLVTGAAYLAACVVALAAVEFVYPMVWILTPVYGHVVDRNTGQPIANAAVAASWTLQSWEGSVVAYLYLGETVTDVNGDFRINVWGPKFHFPQGRVMRTQPEILVIADGYLPEEARSSNDVRSAFFYAGAKNNGQVFQLESAELGDRYERALENFVNYFAFVRENSRCEWSRVPQVMKRVTEARSALAATGRGAGLPAAAPAPRADCI